jgi:hypothetical protein
MHKEVSSKIRQIAPVFAFAGGQSRRISAILLGLLLAATVSASSVTYTYDELGRLKLTTYDNGASTTYTLDAAGNRKKVAMVPPTPVQAPATVTATVASATSVSLSWSTATGGTGHYTYNVYASPSGTVVQSGLTTTTTVITGLSPHTSYSYTVKATDTDGTSSLQSAASTAASTYALPVISSFGGTANSSTAITLTWSPSDAGGPGLSGYTLTRSPGGSIGPPSAAATSYSDSGLTPNTSYTYTLTANDGHTDTASASATVSSLALPSITAFTATPASSSKMTLSWTGADAGAQGALTYTLMRGSTTLGTVTSPYTDSGLAANTSYTYTLTVTDALSEHASASASGTTYALPVVSLTASQTSTSTMTLTFSGSDAPAQGALTYSLMRGSTVLSTTSPFIDVGLSPNTSYSYTVTANDAVGDTNSASASGSTYPLPTATLAVGNSVTSNSVLLDYSAFDNGGPGLSSVSIFLGGSCILCNSTAPSGSFTATGLSPSTAYTFTLYAYDTANPTGTSLASTVTVTTAAAAPSVPSIIGPLGAGQTFGTVTTSPWVVSWTTSPGASYYILQNIFGPSTTNYTITAPNNQSTQSGTNGLDYVFQVQACNSANQCSAFSTSVDITYCDGGVCP